MDIKLIQKNKLIVFLNHSDMDTLDITYDSISWQDEKSRIVFAKLLSLAQIKTGFSINKSNLSIQVVPQFNGCAVLFSLVPKKKSVHIEDTSSPITIHTDSVENIMSLCEKSVECWSELQDSTLLSISGEYFLSLFPKSNFSTKFTNIIQQYGTKIKTNNIIISWLKENAKTICENNAIQSIGNCIIKTDTH